MSRRALAALVKALDDHGVHVECTPEAGRALQAAVEQARAALGEGEARCPSKTLWGDHCDRLAGHRGSHVSDNATWADAAPTPRAAEARAAPKVHRCMRCREEFACEHGSNCAAGYDVLPIIVSAGRVVWEHCPRTAPTPPAGGAPCPKCKRLDCGEFGGCAPGRGAEGDNG